MRHLVLVIGDKLSQLVFHVLRVGRLTAKLAERASSIVEAVALDVPARRVGQEEKSKAENEGEDPLHGHGDAVRTSVHAVLGGIVNDGSQKKANGDAELVALEQ